MRTPLLPEKANPEFQQLSRNRYSLELQVDEHTARALKLMTRRGGTKTRDMLTYCARLLAELSQDGVTFGRFQQHLHSKFDQIPREHDSLSAGQVEADDLVRYITVCRKRCLTPDLSSVRLSPIWGYIEERLRQAGFAKEVISYYAKSCSGGRAWLRHH